MPLEFVLSFTYLALSIVVAPWYFALVTIPLSLFNLSRCREKDHKLYFITKREYKKNFKRMERQYIVKSAVYAVLLLGSLVFVILSATTWLSHISKRDKA